MESGLKFVVVRLVARPGVRVEQLIFQSRIWVEEEVISHCLEIKAPVVSSEIGLLAVVVSPVKVGSEILSEHPARDLPGVLQP